MRARIFLVSVLVLMLRALVFSKSPGDRNSDRIADDFDVGILLGLLYRGEAITNWQRF